MILLNSNNQFYLENINLLLNQKNIATVLNNNLGFFFEIDFHFYNEKIIIKSDTESATLMLPFSFEKLFYKINDLLGKKNIKISNFSYNPLMQIISTESHECNLGNIHNTIFSNLVLNNKGIEKNKLYKYIWPNDVDTQINKLDTHITNLKNKIKNELSLDIKIISERGSLKLIIN